MNWDSSAAAGDSSRHVQPPELPGVLPEQRPAKRANRLKHLSVLSLISNVLTLLLLGPLMGWTSHRLGDAWQRVDQSLPASTAWFMQLSWTKMTIACIALAAALLLMEWKVKRAGLTLTVHLVVTVAVGVLIGAFLYAMIAPMLAMINQTGLS